MGFQTVRALLPVRHNNVLRVPGQTTGPNSQDFVVTDLQAKRLVDNGSVTSIGVAADPSVQQPVSSTQPAPYWGQSYFPGTATTVDINQAPRDVSGNGRHMTLGATLSAAECNANAGYFTSVKKVGGHFASQLRPNFDTDFSVIAFTLNMAPPTGLVFFAGACNYAANQVGVSLGVAADGRPRFYINGSVTLGTGVATIGTAPVVADNTDHTVMIVTDPVQRGFFVWVDGVLTVSLQNAWAAGSGQWSEPFVFGSGTATTGTAQDAKFKQINLYANASATLPSNCGEVASKYTVTKQDVAKIFNPTTREASMWQIGQSNQHGYGPSAGVNATLFGTPIQDPTYPNGVAGRHSLFPAMCAALGQAGWTLHVYNHGFGGSSLIECWVGRVIDWAANQLTKLGSYRAYGGRVFKAVLASQNAMLASTVAPAVGTGADNITWVDAGPDTGTRGIQAYGSSYFDPNGNFAAIFASMKNSSSTRKICDIAFGETDADLGITRDEYRAGMRSAAEALVAGGAHRVGLGFTIGTPGAFATAYNTKLIPGLNDAIQELSNDSRFFASINGAAALGTLSVNPASGIGMQVDGLHFNDPGYEAYGVARANNLLPILASMP